MMVSRLLKLVCVTMLCGVIGYLILYGPPKQKIANDKHTYRIKHTKKSEVQTGLSESSDIKPFTESNHQQLAPDRVERNNLLEVLKNEKDPAKRYQAAMELAMVATMDMLPEILQLLKQETDREVLYELYTVKDMLIEIYKQQMKPMFNVNIDVEFVSADTALLKVGISKVKKAGRLLVGAGNMEQSPWIFFSQDVPAEFTKDFSCRVICQDHTDIKLVPVGISLKIENEPVWWSEEPWELVFNESYIIEIDFTNRTFGIRGG